MKRILLSFIILLGAIQAIGQNVLLYIVDRDDRNFSNITTKLASQKELETDYTTLVLVFDSYRDEVIGGWGSYNLVNKSDIDFKTIVDNAVFDLYSDEPKIRVDESSIANKPRPDIDTYSPINGILGIYWGDNLDIVTNKLRQMRIEKYYEEDDRIMYASIDSQIYLDGFSFPFLIVEYMTSNKQIKYISSLTFATVFETATEAKQFRDNYAITLRLKYGKENVIEDVKENGFKAYEIWINHGVVSTSDASVDIRHTGNDYVVSVRFSDVLTVCKFINRDNEAL